ncbi:DUF2304 domain-containing protein [Rubinisphaera margarita]|uniref:DUF2304 domain-containing protein n=1 Tax=Rubinisphaera margarita TaxID=2909586 RepID=UPI001EE89C6B|nr:DUF2304 domain-containing protein [Rubinisphaera margarita]MCG6154849.1 DUF2304 domain-containing protein [Rubinisphaera margarita]
MNYFQWCTIPILLLLCSRELKRYLSDHRRYRLLRISAWALAVVLIMKPDLSSIVAAHLGIGRGADLVFYAFMLSATAVMFHLYGRQFGMRKQIVDLARREALRTPLAGEGLQTARPGVESSREEP